MWGLALEAFLMVEQNKNAEDMDANRGHPETILFYVTFEIHDDVRLSDGRPDAYMTISYDSSDEDVRHRGRSNEWLSTIESAQRTP